MNRIESGIAKLKLQIEQRLADGLVTQERLDESHKALDIPWDEYTTFQNLKSEAVLNGTLSVEEGMTIYQALGESGPDKFNQQPLEVKSLLTKLFSELLDKKIRQRSA